MTLKDRIRWEMAELGVRTKGISVMIDLVNSCSFKCPSCPVGNSPRRDGGVMNWDTYERIMDRIEEQVKLRYVLLYSFSEPFLSPILPDVVEDLKRRGVKRVMVSTNLSRTKNLEAVLEAGLDELRISFSGFLHGEYFHTGRDLSQFRKACAELAMIAPKYRTRIGLIFHRYKTNLVEQDAVRAFARVHGFDLIPETAFFIPFEKILRDDYTKADRKLIDHLIMSPEEKLKRTERDEICYYQQKQMVIDARGRVYLCRHVFSDEFLVGDILTDPIWEIRRRMATHSFCLACKHHGLNKYTEPT